MFHSKTKEKEINKLHKRALRITYCDFSSTSEELLIKDSSQKIHHKSIQKLAIEIFKVKNGFSNGRKQNLKARKTAIFGACFLKYTTHKK